MFQLSPAEREWVTVELRKRSPTVLFSLDGNQYVDFTGYSAPRASPPSWSAFSWMQDNFPPFWVKDKRREVAHLALGCSYIDFYVSTLEVKNGYLSPKCKNCQRKLDKWWRSKVFDLEKLREIVADEQASFEARRNAMYTILNHRFVLPVNTFEEIQAVLTKSSDRRVQSLGDIVQVFIAWFEQK